MELLPIALITAACVILAYYLGKWVGEATLMLSLSKLINATK